MPLSISLQTELNFLVQSLHRMAFLKLSLFLLLLSIFSISGMVEPALAFVRKSRCSVRSRAYVEASCRATRYPALCIQYLSSLSNSKLQNPQQLAQAALSASLYRAQYTKSYMFKVAKQLKLTKTKEYQVVKDCLYQINDSVQQLSQSIRELGHLGGQKEAVNGDSDNVFWHISNVETWTSAALSDASYCLEEFPGKNMSKLKATIKSRVLNVAQATSNALTLFHQYAAKYRAAGATITKP